MERREPSTSVTTAVLTRWDWEPWGAASQDFAILDRKGVRELAWKLGTFRTVGIIHPKLPTQHCYEAQISG